MSKQSAGQKAAGKISSIVIQVALRVIIYTIVIMVFFIAVRQAYTFGYSLYSAGPVDEEPGTDKTFTVDSGTGDFACLTQLEQSGLISNRYAAMFQEFFYQYDITPGTYTLNTSMTIKEILQELDVGPDGGSEDLTSGQTEGSGEALGQEWYEDEDETIDGVSDVAEEVETREIITE